MGIAVDPVEIVVEFNSDTKSWLTGIVAALIIGAIIIVRVKK